MSTSNTMPGFTPEQMNVLAQMMAAAVAGATPKAAPAQPGAKAPKNQAPTAAPAQPGKAAKGERTDPRTHVKVACKDQHGHEITVGYAEKFGFGVQFPGAGKFLEFHHLRRWKELAEVAAAIPHVYAAALDMARGWGWDVSDLEK